MSGDISDNIIVNISATQATVTQQGFGLPLIVSHGVWPGSGSEFTREYSKAADVLVDWAATTPEYLCAAALFGQSPRPPKLVMGRATAKPTQQFEITPVVISNYTYKFMVNDLVAQFTSDGTATAAEITAGLKTQFDLLGLALTSSQQAGNTVLRLVANVAGAWFRFETLDRTNMPVVQNHVDPGMAANLAAIATERNDWFAVLTTFNSKAYVEATAAYCNTNKKLYGYQTIDTVVPGTPISGTDDIGESLKNLGNDYTWGVYSNGIDDFLAAGLFGARLPKKPGRATWMYTQLSGIPAGTYTPTERANMRAKNIGWYEDTAGVKFVSEGKLASGRFIDFRIHTDYTVARIQERMLRAELVNDKISYDDGGITIVKGCVKEQLQSDTLGQYAPIDPSSIVVTAPLAAAAPAQNRSDRVLDGVTFSYRYTGAIHKIQTVEGVATL